MKYYIYKFIYILLLTYNGQFYQTTGAKMSIAYDESGYELSTSEKQLLDSVFTNSETTLRNLLPALPDSVHIEVRFTETDLRVVDGVTGRADKGDPLGELVVIISTTYPGGVTEAAKDGLASVVYHEFHHLSTGWTMQSSHKRKGIMDAVIKEGLAVVFAETYTGQKQEGNQYPDVVEKWVKEIIDLPADANYMHWVSGEHPDGRVSIGYKAGKYIIDEAIRRSGKSILELSLLEDGVILKLAGF